MKQITLFLVLVSLICNPSFGGDHWPQFRGPGGRGHASATKLPVAWSESQNVVWKTAIHGMAWSSPVIWGDQIWMSTATEDGFELSAVCVDRESGEIIHDLQVFEVEQPREIHVTNSYASPTPAIEAGRVYIHFGSYGTVCLDTQTAERIWERRDLPCHHWRGPGSSPIIFREMLIVHYDGYDYQYVVALNKETGETIWKTDRDVDYGTDNGDIMKAYSTPVIIGNEGAEQLLSPTSKAGIAYDPYSGKELWRVRYEGFSATAQPFVGHGMAYFDTGFSKAELYAVRLGGSSDVTDSHVEWVAKKSVPSKPSPLLVDDLIYMVHDSGVATCLDAMTGATVWQERFGGKYSASPLYAAGRIYFFSEQGVTHVVAHGRKYKQLSENQLDDGFMSSPAVAGNALFLRTRSHLYRIESD